MSGPSHPERAAASQPSLFFAEPATAPVPPPLLVQPPALDPTATLGACALPYAAYLRLTDHSAYTVTCFLSDLRLLSDFLSHETRVRAITREQLDHWLTHLRFERGASPAPKTMARRVTFLKNFFGWLVRTRVLARDPAARIALSRPAPPLPELLYEDEVRRLEQSAAEDTRCCLLVTLLLRTGLKKEEVMGLRLAHVDLSDEGHPAIEVHFPGRAKRRRERRMELPPEWASLYRRYLERYRPRERVFECTARNLNYVLAAAVRHAGLTKRVTLQLLRDIYAVRQLRAGTAPEVLREMLGLSEEAWHETAEKYQKLAFAL